jgi:prepilin-type processing-associated H-X9-DG protein/prepilin-type N-terminal cleavage/methylation domain-containing protein
MMAYLRQLAVSQKLLYCFLQFCMLSPAVSRAWSLVAMSKLQSTTRPRIPADLRGLHAFTLVELLVVIGIIALLISILLPSLNAARRAAQVTACSAKLHSIMTAAQLHRQEHADYYPLAGVMPDQTPAGLDDAYSKKYDYYSAGFSIGNTPETLLAPITNSLETEMVGSKALYAPNGAMGATNGNQDVNQFLDPLGLNAKYFLCPAQATSPLDIKPTLEFLYITIPGGYVCQPQSYIFNEFVVGWDENPDPQVPHTTLGFLRGKGSLIHQPAITMFAADGNGGSIRSNHATFGQSPAPIFTVLINTRAVPVSLADAFNAPKGTGGGNAGDNENFDLIRHRGRMNIAFCDGHVETRSITSKDLANVWLSAQ